MEHLQKLLKEDSEERQKELEAKTARRAQHAPLAKNLETIWKAHGVLATMTGCWVRPIPDHMYQCSLSAPQTTLVSWSSLPQSVRSRLPKAVLQQSGDNNNQQEDEDRVVEVPLAYIQVDEDGAIAGNGDGDHGTFAGRTKHRQLGGNLTNKLSEYTRGVSGQCKPFLPGGLGTHDEDGNPNADIDAFLSEHAVKNALEVLDKGSEASWKDNTILKAPPGVDFKVGLTWEDIHGTPEDDEPVVNQNAPVDTAAEDDDNITYNLIDEPQYAEASPARPTSSTFSTPMWTANDFLDDDSLFGSSDGSDSESDDVDTKAKKKGSLDDLSDDDSSEQEEGEKVDKDAESDKETVDTATDTTSVSTDPNEVDELLLELSLPGTKELEKKKKQAIANNPLALAEQQSQNQQDSTRKEWATTTLLPIDDINTWIPNPAMTFPFTLDGFQQQAIVRLERNESVFVAAHTSAGTYTFMSIAGDCLSKRSPLIYRLCLLFLSRENCGGRICRGACETAGNSRDLHIANQSAEQSKVS